MIEIDPLVFKYLNLVMGQMTFMQSFVEDLLDLRQLRDGEFSLANVPFDPNDVLKVV